MSKSNNTNPRLATVGGQAVLEGVMMKGRQWFAVASRLENGSIKVHKEQWTSVRKKYKILDIPIVRGAVNFVEMMLLSFRTLSISAEALGIDDIEPETKFEKWLDRHFGDKLMNAVMTVASVLGVALAMFLFMWLPSFLVKTIDTALGGILGPFKALCEGVIKILIFIGYMLAVSRMPDIHRTFMYHGAEHKTIFCYEAGLPLTVENVKKQKRFHPRCGTSFIFVMLILSILIFSLPFVTWENTLLRVLTKLALLPFVVGIGFEFIMYAGKHTNLCTRVLSWPGLMMQRITTQEPDDSMIECAIAALKTALPDNFPGYDVSDNPDVEPADGIGISEEEKARREAEGIENKTAEDGEAVIQ